MTCPPSSCPTGSRFKNVTKSPNHPASATGWSTIVTSCCDTWSASFVKRPKTTELPSVMPTGSGPTSGRTSECASPYSTAGIAIRKPAHGPAAPTSKSAVRFVGVRMRMKAPKVPIRNGGPGMKYGGVASTPCQRDTTKWPISCTSRIDISVIENGSPRTRRRQSAKGFTPAWNVPASVVVSSVARKRMTWIGLRPLTCTGRRCAASQRWYSAARSCPGASG